VKLLTKPAVSVVKEAITNWLPDVINTRRYTGLVTLLDEAFKIQDYGNLLHSVFGEKLDISQRELTEVKKYHKTIIDHYGLQLPYPG